MAKFKKSLVPQTRSITLAFRVKDEDTGTEESATCTHVFRRPTGKELMKHKKLSIKVRGTKADAQIQEANFWLWKQCILHVIGYEEDGLTSQATRADLIKYFDDGDLGRIHAEEFASELIEAMGADIAEEEKKLEPSSVELSGQPRMTPTPTTK